MKKEEIIQKVTDAIKKMLDERQDRPDQYIVAYFRTSDDSLIGYHLSTFCQTTGDILKAKRYSGDNPYSQLAIIAKNLRYTLKKDHEGMFAKIHEQIRDIDFAGLDPGDIYMDAIYLAEGTPKQNFTVKVIE